MYRESQEKKGAALVAVTNRHLCRIPFLKQVERLARAGVDEIVLREKDLAEWEYERLATEVLAVCGHYGVTPVLHQHPAVAEWLGAKYLHLPLSVAQECRGELASFRRVGVSIHSPEQLLAAEECGAGVAFYGHVFATDCKKGVPPRGVASLEGICRQASIPIYAIGGISSENVMQALDAGASGVCIMSLGMQGSEEEIRSLSMLAHSHGRRYTKGQKHLPQV